MNYVWASNFYFYLYLAMHDILNEIPVQKFKGKNKNSIKQKYKYN